MFLWENKVRDTYKAENLEDVEKLWEPTRPYLEVKITVGSAKKKHAGC